MSATHASGEQRAESNLGPEVLVESASLLENPPQSAHALVEVDAIDDREALVPGAVHLSLSDFSGDVGPTTGRRPLPRHEDLTNTLLKSGIGADTTLLLYAREASDVANAARGWVTLKWAGSRAVRFFHRERAAELLEHSDALQAWITQSQRFAQKSPEPFEADPSVVATYEEVRDRSAETSLLDVRGSEPFEKGHVPGAVNSPAGQLLADLTAGAGTEAIQGQVEEHLRQPLSESSLIVSCGSGMSASVAALGLASIGVHAPVYIGSWSEWEQREA